MLLHAPSSLHDLYKVSTMNPPPITLLHLSPYRNEMAELENELHKTKALYVELCDEKKSLEENMEKQMSALKEESLEQVSIQSFIWSL